MRKKDLSTEEQIKQAAKELFLEKGFDATSIRDIAEAAGTNVALLNYYFRSKQGLYDLIVREIFSKLFEPVKDIFDQEGLTVNDMMDRFVDMYTDYFAKNQEVPVFVVEEFRRNPKGVLPLIPVEALGKTRFVGLLGEPMREEIGGVPYFVHILLNALSMLVFPVFLEPLFREGKGLEKKTYSDMVAVRKQMLPIWLNTMVEMAQ